MAVRVERTGQPSPARLAPGRFVVGGALSLVVLAVLVGVADLDRVGDGLATAPSDPLTLAIAGVAYTAAFWLRAVAWRALLATRVSTAALFSILQTSLFLNHLLPIKAGEVARPLLATRRGVMLAEAVSTTVVARALDFGALLLIALAAVPSVTHSAELGLAVGAVATLLTVACAGLVAVRLGALARIAAPLGARLAAARDALATIDSARLALATPLVVASWLLESAVLLVGARLIGVDLSMQVAVGATAFTILFQVVHVTPGGLGVYEASMTSVLVAQGVSVEDALAAALVTHGLKFAYSYTIGLAFAVGEVARFGWARFVTRPDSEGRRVASRFEIVSARLWNVLNEGKPFTPVFVLGVVVLLGAIRLDASYWRVLPLAVLAVAPLLLVCWRFDFPLRLRAALWVALLAWVVLFRFVSLPAATLVLSLYMLFTVVLWGTVYYHLRIGTPWSNILRFWRLVLENPDPTSGNFLEQIPKLLLILFAFEYVASAPSWQAVASVEVFTVAFAIVALLVHQWAFTWVPALPQPGYAQDRLKPARTSRRVIVIAIDGCRADRLREARTPFIDRLRAEGTEYTGVSTVYPARTVTCFASMLTGAAPNAHGMRSNFVPSLGVKCDSVFRALEREGLCGAFVGIAHLIDAFGERDVRTVSAVMHNDEIDHALVARAKDVLRDEDPELLVLQLLSVDQTGHSRGSYNEEYLGKIEATDRIVEDFLSWCGANSYLDETTVLITADHGQGIGIGGHGHMSPPEITIPCVWWGAGVEVGRSVSERRFITDIAPTICHLLGATAPEQSVGRALLPVDDAPRTGTVFVIPAQNEEANLPAVLRGIAALSLADVSVVVVDDGSRDRTAEVAAAHGAIVVQHEVNRGLGAALRTGLAVARDRRPKAAVYLDADGEYDPADARRLLAPIERGEADYVLGSRFRGSPDGMTRSRRFANVAFSALLSMLCGRRISDGQTGIRAFSARALDIAEIVHDYNYAQVLTLDLLHKGMRLAEVPVTYKRRRYGRSFITGQYLWRVPVGIAREMLRG